MGILQAAPLPGWLPSACAVCLPSLSAFLHLNHALHQGMPGKQTAGSCFCQARPHCNRAFIALHNVAQRKKSGAYARNCLAVWLFGCLAVWLPTLLVDKGLPCIRQGRGCLSFGNHAAVAHALRCSLLRSLHCFFRKLRRYAPCQQNQAAWHNP